MQAVKREFNEELMLSAKMEAQQRINRIRMAIKMAVMKTEGTEESDLIRMTELRKKLTEEELEAKRQINRIRMAILRARRTEEQIMAERMSQRARMAALRRKRSEQEMQTVREAKRAQMAAFRKRRTEEQAEADRRINRLRMAMLRAGRSEKQLEQPQSSEDSAGERKVSRNRRQLTEEELEVRRRINRVRVAMLRAQRTEEQIEAERLSQRQRMAELRRRRSVEQIKNELESQRARMAALRRRRKSGEVPMTKRNSLSEQEVRGQQFVHYLEEGNSGRSGDIPNPWCESSVPNEMSIEEIKMENIETPKEPMMENCTPSQWSHHDASSSSLHSIKMETSENIPYQVPPPPPHHPELCCQSPWCVPQMSVQPSLSEMPMSNCMGQVDKMCRSVHCTQTVPYHPNDGSVSGVVAVNDLHPAIKPIVILKTSDNELGYH